MMNLTRTLKAAIAFERSKTDPANLNNHKAEDLAVMIEVINNKMEVIQDAIDTVQRHFDNAEDLSEGLIMKWNEALAANRATLETLLAYRNLFMSAWSKNSKSV